ncbi:Uncharacterised protein [Escherichia coli]|nr:Uncharacterised protein [Escherichia coli]
MFATKDAAHRQCLVVVGDDQGVSVQLRFGTVEQYQRFALFRHPHHNAAFNAIFIESVHRLAQFEQHIVGDVNNCIDRTDSRNDAVFLSSTAELAL